MKIKKVIIGFFALIIMGQAISATSIDFDVCVAGPFVFGSYKDKNQTFQNGIGGIHAGVDLGIDVMFTDFFGLGCNLEHYGSIITSYTLEGLGLSEKTGKEIYFRDCAVNLFYTAPQFSTTIFLGPTIRPVNKEKFKFDITPGADINLITITDGGILNRQKPGFFYFIFETGCGLDLNFKWKKSNNSWISLGFLTTCNFFSLTNGYNIVFDKIPNDDVKLDKIIVKNMASSIFTLAFTPRIGCTILF